MKRRKFVQGLSRFGLAGGLLTITGALWWNGSLQKGTNCAYTPICRQCKEFSTCDKVPLEINSLDNGK